jgi:hypothetical protein
VLDFNLIYEKVQQRYITINYCLWSVFFSPVKFCSFNTLIYPSKNIYWQKLWIVNMFNMFLKVQCRYKHMAWTTLLHLVHIVIALERIFGVVQRIQFRCFPFPKRTSLFMLPRLTRWRRLITLSTDNAWTIRLSELYSSVFCWYKIYAFYVEYAS